MHIGNTKNGVIKIDGNTVTSWVNGQKTAPKTFDTVQDAWRFFRHETRYQATFHRAPGDYSIQGMVHYFTPRGK